MRYFLIGLFLFILLGCSSQNKEERIIGKYNKSPKYKKYKLNVKKIMTIGSNELTKEDYLIGRIADFTIDSQNNVYICDDINIVIKKFSEDGKFIQIYGKGEGEGPGEFLIPRRIQVNSSYHLFVLDYNLNRIIQFSPEGEFLNMTMIKTLRPGKFLISEGVAYVLGLLIYNTPPVQIIDLMNNKLINAFGTRSKDSLLVAKSGNCGSIEFDSKKNILYADYFPYKISIFSSDGKLITNFSRKAPFLRPPTRTRSTKTGNYYICPQGGIRDIVTYRGEYIIVLVNEWPQPKGLQEGKKVDQILDIFDKSGTWLLSIPIARYFDTRWTRMPKFDNDGNLYLSTDEPFPQLMKYSFKLKDKDGCDILIKR